MNSNDLNPNYNKLYMILEGVFEKIGYFNYGHHDETLCTMRVFETAKEIIERLNCSVKKEVVLTAAIFHDVGKSALDLDAVTKPHVTDAIVKEWNSHIKKSVPLAKEILLEEGHSVDFVNEVCYLIGHHNKALDGLDERSIELKVLQDADIVADEGIVDLLRCFSYGGINKRPLISSIKYLLNKKTRAVESNRLNLDVSKEIAKEKMKTYTVVLKELALLIDSDLIKNKNLS